MMQQLERLKQSEIQPDYKEQYFQLKQKFNQAIDSQLLVKYKLLSQAYKLGKKAYGTKFSVHQLAHDYEIPYTTAKRCLSLSKANKSTWELVKSKKISLFKVAMILMSKDVTFQDEIVNLVIKHNLSTHKIKDIKVKDYKDVAINDTKLAISKGFSRKYEGYLKFLSAINRINEFLYLDTNTLTPKYKANLKSKLIKLNKRINEYLKRL